jgi:hypothetical protein
MAEVLLTFESGLYTEDGEDVQSRACGRERSDGMWEGWIEFEFANGKVVRTPRETSQPNRADLVYWATGLTSVYLEGALHRALHPTVRTMVVEKDEPRFHAPAETESVIETPSASTRAHREAILDPFSVYQKGEALLRQELNALSSWHLANIATAHGLVPPSVDVDRLTQGELIDWIVAAVRTATSTSSTRR